MLDQVYSSCPGPIGDDGDEDGVISFVLICRQSKTDRVGVVGDDDDDTFVIVALLCSERFTYVNEGKRNEIRLMDGLIGCVVERMIRS